MTERADIVRLVSIYANQVGTLRYVVRISRRPADIGQLRGCRVAGIGNMLGRGLRAVASGRLVVPLVHQGIEFYGKKSNDYDKVSARINAIRRANGGTPDERCPLCGRHPGSPFRQWDDSGHVVVLGCIDASHTGHLVAGGRGARGARGVAHSGTALGVPRIGVNGTPRASRCHDVAPRRAQRLRWAPCCAGRARRASVAARPHIGRAAARPARPGGSGGM